MPLNEMSLEELEQLSERLNALREVGRQLEACTYEPTFNLTPGQLATITLPFAMPEAPGQATKADVQRIEAKLDLCLELSAETEMPTPSPEAAPDLTHPGEADPARSVPEETPPAAEGLAGGSLSAVSEADAGDAAPSGATASVSLAPAASHAEDAAEGGGGAVMAAAIPPAAAPPASVPGPVPGSASALAASSFRGLGAPGWTEEEDQRLIALVVTGVVQLGKTKMAAIADAAQELNRPHDGVKSRCYGKLKDRLTVALTAVAMKQAQTETPSPEIPEPDMEPGQREAEIVVNAAASIEGQLAETSPTRDPASFTADPVTSHLMSLPEKGAFGGGWTLERDLELMELSIAGWQPNEIALQLTVQANLIKPRFDMLTGIYEDANGKKVRRFSREAVFAALQRLTGKAA